MCWRRPGRSPRRARSRIRISEYLHDCGEKRVYAQMVVFEDRRGAKMFERYGFKVLNKSEITKYRDLHPEPVYLCTIVKDLDENSQLYVRSFLDRRLPLPAVLSTSEIIRTSSSVSTGLKRTCGVDTLQEGIHLGIVGMTGDKEETAEPAAASSFARPGKTCRPPSSA